MRLSETFEMRPDKVAFQTYGNVEYTEMILKYSAISNPFTLDKDDVLMIPSDSEVYSQLAQDVEDEKDKQTKENQIKNLFKFKNNFKSDKSSYDQLEKLKVGSGVIEHPQDGDYSVPYISEDGTASITFRNGRMYFGEDSGISA